MPTKENYKPTGWNRGRPRRGEIRPTTESGLRSQAYREDHKNDPEWKAIQTMYQQFWCLANAERRKEIARDSYRRRKLWKDSKIKIS